MNATVSVKMKSGKSLEIDADALSSSVGLPISDWDLDGCEAFLDEINRKLAEIIGLAPSFMTMSLVEGLVLGIIVNLHLLGKLKGKGDED